MRIRKVREGAGARAGKRGTRRNDRADHLEVVSISEVAEHRVVRDEHSLTDRNHCEERFDLRVQRIELRHIGTSIRSQSFGVQRCDVVDEEGHQRIDHLRHARGVGEEVGVDRRVVSMIIFTMIMLVRSFNRHNGPNCLEQGHTLVPGRCNHIAESSFETRAVQHQGIGGHHLSNLTCGSFEVVRIGTIGHDRDNGDDATRHLFNDITKDARGHDDRWTIEVGAPLALPRPAT